MAAADPMMRNRKTEDARLLRQRRLVETMRRRLHFEILVLRRMEGGRAVREAGPADIADLLARARARFLGLPERSEEPGGSEPGASG